MDAKEAYKRLLKIFPISKPTNEFYEEFCKVIGKYAPHIIQAACENAVENDTRFPSIALFRSYCSQFVENEELKRHKEQMEADKKTADAFYKSPDWGKGDFAKNCIANIRSALAGQVTIREFIENSKKLGLNISSFIEHCHDKGIDMDNVIGAQYMHDFSGTKGKPIKRKGFREIV